MCWTVLFLAVILLMFASSGGGGGPDSPGISRALRHYESMDTLADDDGGDSSDGV